MERTVIIAGGGPAGLAAACLLAKDGVMTTLIAPPPIHDPRTVALMQPAIQLLKYLEIWPADLEAQTAPLRKLRIIDETGALIASPTVEFDSKEIGLDAFGWNLPLALLLPALQNCAQNLGVRFIEGTVDSAIPAEDHICIIFSNGETLEAQLAIAADGANSVLRASAGISTDTWNYDQTAIATSFAHSQPHNDVSTEFHRAAGPFTTVPMAGLRSSLVWMERPARAAEIMALDDQDLAAEIQVVTHGNLGLISAIGARKAFPMKGLTARRFAKSRTLLVGEAAHMVPPIGAQGLNMSLRDAALAADLILGNEDAGAAAVLTEYNKLRRAEVLPRQQAVNFMNRSLLEGFLPLEAARVAGFTAIKLVPPLKRAVMRRGIAPVRNTPFAMRETPVGETP